MAFAARPSIRASAASASSAFGAKPSLDVLAEDHGTVIIKNWECIEHVSIRIVNEAH